MGTVKATLKILAVCCLILFLAGAVIFAATRFADGQIRNKTPVTCRTKGKNHQVVMRDDMVTPEHTAAPLCDTLTITNEDNLNRLVAFGPHDHHTPYDGVTARLLTSGQSLTVTLNQTGNFRFHDHLHDTVQGTFTVTD
jgi:hypothetical protein